MQKYERSRKSSHLDTVHYEIDMLEYAREKVLSFGNGAPQPELNMALECYLLHYRNLIEFFSGEKHRKTKKAADISVANAKAWCGRDLTAEERDALSSSPRNLVAKYFDDLSQFLQHCTERRFLETRDWDVKGMSAELQPTIDLFRKIFPQTHQTTQAPPLDYNSTSTATFVRSKSL